MWMYADENEGRLPWSGGGNADCLEVLYSGYLAEPRVFRCPSDRNWEDPRSKEERKKGPLRFTNSKLDAPVSYRTSYDYLGAYTTGPIVVPPPEMPIPKVPVMWDIFTSGRDSRIMSNHVPGGGNVLWLDGSVTFLKAQFWAGDNMPYRPAGLEYTDPGEALKNIDTNPYN